MSTSGMFSTSEGHHEYIRGCSVHRRDIMCTSGGYHEYIGGCSVQWRDTMMHLGEYHEYIGGFSVRQRDTMIHVERYHDSYGGKPCVHRGFQYKPKAFINLLPHMNHDIPSMYSWYTSDVLNMPQCTHDIPHVNHEFLRRTEHTLMY